MLLIGALFALHIQVQVRPNRERRTVVRDSIVDTATTAAGRRRLVGHRLPVTAEVLATAFKDPAARPLLLRARAARLAQDSALTSYDATAYQRLSVFMSFTEAGRKRPMFINESAIRVQWKRDVGAWVDMRGARSAIPLAPPEEADDELRGDLGSDMMSPIPYFPGYESLWIGGTTARAQVDDGDIVHPLAEGAEAYYRYETGDSLSFTLPDGKTTRLRALLIRPRSPKWNLAVGTLWFDVATGQLVRAAYRLSVPIDVMLAARENDSTAMKDVPVVVKALITPLVGQVSAVAVEYGLYEGHFWLPRIRALEGSAQVSFIHVPFTMQHTFRYTSVNATKYLPPIPINEPERRRVRLDTMTAEERTRWRDSVRAAAAASRDSIRRGLKDRARRFAACDTADYRVSARYRYGDAHLPVAVKIPCDLNVLKNSPELPPSIYDPDDERFGATARDALISEALKLGAQPPLALGRLFRPTVSYGAQLTRYNRVEGFSSGIRLYQEIGGGYSAALLGRLGLADREPNAELTVTRTNLSKSIHVSGYNRLVSASDWGHPFTFGSSLSALLFGRDEGFYYRASGAELGGTREALFGRGAHVDWRVFVENERTAQQSTAYSVFGGAHTTSLPANVLAANGAYAGAAVHLSHARGLDPRGFRLLTDVRLETAVSDSAYARGALELTASRGLGRLAGALTVSGGSSLGALPLQRRWFLGGSQTIRGQSPDTAQSGNAYWLARAELGENDASVRPVIFADLGWSGDRSKLSDIGRPLSGVGSGMSFFDGLLRFDVARGLHPRKQWRADFYLEARF